jgi:hypothetical protein
MGKDWTIVQHTGKRMDLERGDERKQIRAPKDPQRRQGFRELRPRQPIDDVTIALFIADNK